jgi:DNA uptake protein ComE-like DNA-binding protein
LHALLMRLFKQWHALALDDRRVPRIGASDDVDEEVLGLLAMEAHSVSYRLRSFVDEPFVAWMLIALRDFVFGPDTPYGRIHANPKHWVQRWAQEWQHDRAEAAQELAALTAAPAGKLEASQLMHLLGWWKDLPLELPLVQQGDVGPLTYLRELLLGQDVDSQALLHELLRRALELAPDSPLGAAGVRDAIATLANVSVLEFFNAVTTPEQLVERVQDDPEYGIGPPRAYGIRRSLARRILEKRATLPGGVFTSLQQIDEIFGVGEDTLHDILYSFRDQGPKPDLDQLFRGALDACTYRLDAWITSLATKRLHSIRAEVPTGLRVGAYGWVELLQPRGSEPVSDGYVHAPSRTHAATSAVLHSAFRSHADPGAENPLRINLNSERVRRALHVLEGMRQGQPLGAVLGYQFERALHDHWSGTTQHSALIGPGLNLTDAVGQGLEPLDQYIDDFREDFPLVAHKEEPADAGEAAESVAARNVVDGVALARRWLAVRGGEPAEASSMLGRMASLPSAHRWALETKLNRLQDGLDAVGDVLLSESVYQAVQGNFERGGSALEAASGNVPPPDIESVMTPMAGHLLGHRVCLLLPEALGNGPGPATPRAVAEPRLAAWVAELLGDLSQIGFGFTFPSVDANGDPSERVDLNTAAAQALQDELGITAVQADAIVQGRPYGRIGELQSKAGLDASLIEQLRPMVTTGADTMTVAELGLAAVDLVYLAHSPLANENTEIEQRMRYAVRAEFALRADVPVDLSTVRQPGFPSGLGETLELARHLLALRGSGTVLRPDALDAPSEGDAGDFTTADLTRFATRVQNASLALQALLADLATPLANDDSNRAAVLDAVLRAGHYGLAAALPAAPSDTALEGIRQAAREELSGRRERADNLVTQAMAAVDGNGGAEPAAGSTARIMNTLVQAMQALFGGSFLALPDFATLQSGQLAQAFDQPGLLAGQDASRVRLWLQQAAQVRPPLRLLDDLMTVAEAWAGNGAAVAALTLHVAQLPYEPDRRWGALSDQERTASGPAPERSQDHGSFSLVAAVAGTGLTNGGGVFPARLAGLLLDRFEELIPSDTVHTSVGFHYDGPNAQAPQTLLLAVPPQRGRAWSTADLAAIVKDTMELAKVRLVDSDALGEREGSEDSIPPIGRALPALLFPTAIHKSDWALDAFGQTVEEWLAALEPATCVDLSGLEYWHRYEEQETVEIDAFGFRCTADVVPLFVFPLWEGPAGNLAEASPALTSLMSGIVIDLPAAASRVELLYAETWMPSYDPESGTERPGDESIERAEQLGLIVRGAGGVELEAQASITTDEAPAYTRFAGSEDDQKLSVKRVRLVAEGIEQVEHVGGWMVLLAEVCAAMNP